MRSDPTISTVSSTDEPIVFGVAAPPKTMIPPDQIGETSIVAYTFGPGPMGLQIEDAQGGTRVVIGEVAVSSQAERMGVPSGGILMKVNGRVATGKRRVEVGRWLAAAERPLLLHIMHPGGAGAAAAAAGTVAAADAEELETHAASLKMPECNHPAAKLGPISSHTFRALSQARMSVRPFAPCYC
jgi:hypothetical protein